MRKQKSKSKSNPHSVNNEEYIMSQLRKVEIFVGKCFCAWSIETVQYIINGGKSSEVVSAFETFLAEDRELKYVACLLDLAVLRALKKDDDDSFKAKACYFANKYLSGSTEGLGCIVFENLLEKTDGAFDKVSSLDVVKLDTEPYEADGLDGFHFVYSMRQSQLPTARVFMETVWREVLIALSLKIAPFVKSQEYSLWRAIHRGHAIAVADHDSLEEDLFQNVEGDSLSDNSASPRKSSNTTIYSYLRNSMFLLRGHPTTVALGYDESSSRELTDDCSSERDLYSSRYNSNRIVNTALTPNPAVKLYNSRVHDCDPFLNVLVESLSGIPIGIALHGVVSSVSSQLSASLRMHIVGSSSSSMSAGSISSVTTSSTTSGTANEYIFPYEYMNPCYAMQCSSFSSDLIQGSHCDLMYMHNVTQQTPPPGSPHYEFKYCDSSNVATMLNGLMQFKSIVTVVPMRKYDDGGDDGYISVMGWVPMYAGAPIVEKEKEAPKKKSENNKINYLKSALLGMSAKSLAIEEVEDLSVSNQSQSGSLLRPKYYVCLQTVVPVQHIRFGCTAAEHSAVTSTQRNMLSLLKYFPVIIDPHKYNVFE